jgi:hypothetical protein
VTVSLNEDMADDAEEVVIAWMAPLRRSATVRDPLNDPLPFTLITHIGGGEIEEESIAEPILSIHTLCDKQLGWSAAKEQCRLTHRRMLWLARHLENIPLTDGRIAGVDYVETLELPRWEPYGDDQILQKIGRYQIGFTFVAVP